MVRDGWKITITSLSQEQMGRKEINDLYRVRWDIEIQFRALKQSLQLKKVLGRRMGFYQIEALTLTAIIHHLLSSRCYRILTDLRGRAKVSREKLCKLFSQYITTAKVEDDVWDVFDHDPRHVKPERKPATSQYTALPPCLA